MNKKVLLCSLLLSLPLAVSAAETIRVRFSTSLMDA